MLNELDFPEAPPVEVAESIEQGGSPAEEMLGLVAVAKELGLAVSADEREELTISDLAGTALHVPPSPPRLVRDSVAEVRGEPLLGLHNRDYVSIWVLHRMARYASPMSFDAFLNQVTKSAWYFGSQLALLEREHPGRKLAVLFPTNVAKRPSAERGFQSFAVGNLIRRDGKAMTGAGPLFAWHAVGVSSLDRLEIGLTDSGLRLISDLEGISLELPHARSLATRFLAYLAEHAPRDRWGFDHVVRSAVAGPSREELVNSFAAADQGWSRATASSVAQGYVARAREWGLLEPRLIDGRYWLTEAGREFEQEIKENSSITKGADLNEQK